VGRGQEEDVVEGIVLSAREKTQCGLENLISLSVISTNGSCHPALRSTYSYDRTKPGEPEVHTVMENLVIGMSAGNGHTLPSSCSTGNDSHRGDSLIRIFRFLEDHTGVFSLAEEHDTSTTSSSWPRPTLPSRGLNDIDTLATSLMKIGVPFTFLMMIDSISRVLATRPRPRTRYVWGPPSINITANVRVVPCKAVKNILALKLKEVRRLGLSVTS